jgi:uncharacterized coiled-coil protein SlyX
LFEGENAMADTADKESQAGALPSKETRLYKQPATLNRRSSRTAIVVSLSALGVIGAAIYALPNLTIELPYISSALPNFSSLAELFPRATASVPIPDLVVSAALKDIQSVQQQNADALHENEAVLQRNAVLLQENTTALASLRQSLTDHQTNLKGISSQLSSLIGRVDDLQNAVMPLTTSSITVPHARAKMIAVSRKRAPRLPKPFGPVSVGGAPLSPAPAPEGA